MTMVRQKSQLPRLATGDAHKRYGCREAHGPKSQTQALMLASLSFFAFSRAKRRTILRWTFRPTFQHEPFLLDNTASVPSLLTSVPRAISFFFIRVFFDLPTPRASCQSSTRKGPRIAPSLSLSINERAQHAMLSQSANPMPFFGTHRERERQEKRKISRAHHPGVKGWQKGHRSNATHGVFHHRDVTGRRARDWRGEDRARSGR